LVTALRTGGLEEDWDAEKEWFCRDERKLVPAASSTQESWRDKGVREKESLGGLLEIVNSRMSTRGREGRCRRGGRERGGGKRKGKESRGENCITGKGGRKIWGVALITNSLGHKRIDARAGDDCYKKKEELGRGKKKCCRR